MAPLDLRAWHAIKGKKANVGDPNGSSGEVSINEYRSDKVRNQALNIVRALAEKLGWKEESMLKWSAQLLSRPKRTLALMRGL